MGCLVAGVIFILLGVFAMVLIMVQGGGDNALTQGLGITGASLKSTLITLTSLVFAFFALALLILTVVLTFRRTVIPAAEKDSRKQALKKIIISAVLFLVTLFSWAIVYVILSGLQIADTYDDIITDPTSVTQLTGPVSIQFSAKQSIQENTSYCSWDFNNDEQADKDIAGCNITYTFDEIGRYNVILFHDNGKAKKEVTIDNLRPTAILTATPEEGKAPLQVELDASGSYDPNGNITKYEWNFGQTGEVGWTEGESRTFVTYEEVGDYTVSLRLTDNNGAQTTQKITISAQAHSDEEMNPIIRTTPSEPTGTAPIQIRFDASESTSPFGNIRSYTWDFGDGTAGQNGRSVSHTYTTGGEFQVTLTIQDMKNNTASTNKTVVINAAAIAPIAKITTDQDLVGSGVNKYLSGVVPFTVLFSGTDSTDKDNNIVDYKWDFDSDGTIDSEGAEIEYTFNDPGETQITLTVIDADGQASTATITAQISQDSLRPIIVADPTPTTGPAPLVVSFDASPSEYEDGDILSYEWDFDDGSQPILGDAQVSHIFNLVGEYEVSMTVYTDDQREATATKRVIVRNIPLKAEITPSIAHGPAPLKVTFDPSESTGSIKTYLWNFNDGETSNQTRPTHTFEDPGTYEVKLTVTDSSNNIASTTYQIIVETAN